MNPFITTVDVKGKGYTERRLAALHRSLWKWLSEHPEKEKDAWPRWKMHKEIQTVHASCFACASQRGCDDCPINWGINENGERNICYMNPNTLYKKWQRAYDKERSDYARQIAKLKWNYYKKEEK